MPTLIVAVLTESVAAMTAVVAVQVVAVSTCPQLSPTSGERWQVVRERIAGLHGKHSTGCGHRLAGHSRPVKSEQDIFDCAIRQTIQHLLVCPYGGHVGPTMPALPRTRQRLTASPSAVPGIWRARFDIRLVKGK